MLILALYPNLLNVSNSDKYLNDVKEANAILKELEKRLQS